MFSRDITNMKGTIVAQVDSSESFQEFCSTGCLGAYENKQNPPKSGLKTKCTVCGKLTEVSDSENTQSTPLRSSGIVNLKRHTVNATEEEVLFPRSTKEEKKRVRHRREAAAC